MGWEFYVFASVVAVLLVSTISARGRAIFDALFELVELLRTHVKELRLIRVELDELRETVDRLTLEPEPIIAENVDATPEETESAE